MPTNFLQIASELRNQIYELVIQYQEPIVPWNEWRPSPKLDIALLLVNKAVHCEASSLFYGQNCFDFSGQWDEHLADFLHRIGCTNAGYIRRIRMSFPYFPSLESDGVALHEDDILASLRTHCTNLTTIVTTPSSTDDILNYALNRDILKEVLNIADPGFRAIPTLKDIIVEVYKDVHDAQTMAEMEKLGWTIKKVEYEDSDYDGLFSDFVDYLDRHHDFSEEEYDSDNFIDF